MLLGGIGAGPAVAQVRLYDIDDETTVRKISFKFAETKTLDETAMKEQIALQEPGFFDRLGSWIPFLFGSAEYPFSPVELAKDRVRLIRYYNQNGFLHPQITYAASQLDTTDNEIHVIFSITEGPPVIIQDVSFLGTDGRFAFYQFPEFRQEDWINFRDAIRVETGDRYTEFDRVRIQDQALQWLQNQGYAFARVRAEADVDPVQNTADLRFLIDAGPVGYFDEIVVEGDTLVSERVIRRELPFEPGDRFSSDALERGQRELFALNLFRLALTSVPPAPEEQPRDSTVRVLVRVREAEPRYVSAQTGYNRDQGVSLSGEWTHRNFFGGARNQSVQATLNTGVGAWARQGGEAPFRFRVAAPLRQPYLFTTKLSGNTGPYFLYDRDDLGEGYEAGLTSGLTYEIYQFRVVNLTHTFARVFGQPALPQELVDPDDSVDPFNRNVLSLSGAFGFADNFLAPTEGFRALPFLEVGLPLAGELTYTRVGGEVRGYLPLRPRISLAGRLFSGRLFLHGSSRYNEQSLFNPLGLIRADIPLEQQQLENQFDRIRFYAGVGCEVRGWNNGELGPEVVRAVDDQRRFVPISRLHFQLDTGAVVPASERPEGAVVEDVLYTTEPDDDGRVDTLAADFRPEPLGGLFKLATSVELRLPFPGFGPKWSTAAFLDAGTVSEGNFRDQPMRFGIGGGVRYETLVGFIRVDVAYKVNPSVNDVYSPEDRYFANLNGETLNQVGPFNLSRFALHLSIGQAF